MSYIKNEVIQKLRSEIRAKLDQIGAFVDNELADYIMVMVANQKSRYQMKDDLSLFLGKDTDDFVNWLHDNLKNMQMTAIAGEDRKLLTSKKLETQKDVTSNSSLNIDKLRQDSEKNVNKEDIILDDTIITANTNNDVKADNMRTLQELNESENALNTNTNEANTSKTIISVADDTNDKNNKVELDQTDQEVVLHLRPDGGEIDELLQESDINEEKNIEKKQIKDKSIRRIKVDLQKRIASNAPTSTIGAVLRNMPPEDDDDTYDPSRPTVGNVASVVRVTERKSSVPLELQANKMLILRAVNDAHKSTSNAKKRGVEQISDKEIEYTPTPIKKRLGDRQDRQAIAENNVDMEYLDLDPTDLRNYLNTSKKDNEVTTDVDNVNNSRIVKPAKLEPLNTQFVVTLDGVNHKSFMKDREDDEILLDEEMDDEFAETDNGLMTNIDDNDDDSNMNSGKLNERCRYWPTCKNGDDCTYRHPSTPCKLFPNCRFGDKCLYIHPNCKFDGICTRKECPYTHNKRKIPTSPAIISSLLPPSSVKQCKYFPNCKNPACPYYHPKLCHFGNKCRQISCPFVHMSNISNYASLPAIPPPHQLKWKAKDHISERTFAVTSVVQSSTNS